MSIINLRKIFQTPQGLPRCDAETGREQMVLGNGVPLGGLSAAQLSVCVKNAVFVKLVNTEHEKMRYVHVEYKLVP